MKCAWGPYQCELCRAVELQTAARRWALAAGLAALAALAFAWQAW